MLLQYSARLPGSRVLEDSYQSNLAGVAVPKSNAGRLSYINAFLEGMKRTDRSSATSAAACDLMLQVETSDKRD